MIITEKKSVRLGGGCVDVNDTETGYSHRACYSRWCRQKMLRTIQCGRNVSGGNIDHYKKVLRTELFEAVQKTRE